MLCSRKCMVESPGGQLVSWKVDNYLNGLPGKLTMFTSINRHFLKGGFIILYSSTFLQQKQSNKEDPSCELGQILEKQSGKDSA